jgi:hypothetical protein
MKRPIATRRLQAAHVRFPDRTVRCGTKDVLATIQFCAEATRALLSVKEAANRSANFDLVRPLTLKSGAACEAWTWDFSSAQNTWTAFCRSDG